MKFITRDTDYALRALCYIAKAKEQVVTVSELVGSLRIPRPFLRKLLQLLNKKRILKSYKGKNGGFSLALPTNEIFLLDLMNIFQGPLELNECYFKKKACPNKKSCLLRRKMSSIEKSVAWELKTVNLASLLGRKG